MDIANSFDNYDFIKLGELKLLPDTKIVILYARFMHNSGINWTMDTHSHSFYELHLPLDGTCSIIMQNYQEIALSPGQHLLIHPNTNHKFTDFSDDFFRLSIAFDIQHQDKLLNDGDKYITNQSTEKTLHLLKEMLSEYNRHQIGYKNVVKFHIQTIMIDFLRSYPSILCIEEKKNDANRNVMNEALSFIKNNVSSSITTEDVAKNVCLSSRQLNRIFTQNINMTISEFIRNERILRVKEHLKKTNLSLQEIASLTGFNDEYVLCKTFKKATGITPGKYRLNLKKGEK